MSKFIFYISEKIGIVEAIKNRIIYVDPPILLEISGIESGDLGDFEIINQ